MITVETRRVYVSEVGHDRRGYLTLDAALRRTAYQLLKKRCECEGADESTGYPGETCAYHSWVTRDGEMYPSLAERIADRFVRFYRWRVRGQIRESRRRDERRGGQDADC